MKKNKMKSYPSKDHQAIYYLILEFHLTTPVNITQQLAS